MSLGVQMMKKVHLFENGVTLCGITKRPCDWSKNQAWVPPSQAYWFKGSPKDLCKKCKKVYDERVSGAKPGRNPHIPTIGWRKDAKRV